MNNDKNALNNASEIMQKYGESYSNNNSSVEPQDFKSKADKILSGVGYEYFATGTYRRVYNRNDTVLKVAIGRQGIKENSSEIRNNNRISGTKIQDIIDKGTCDGNKYIADIREFDNENKYWIVMDKVNVTPNNVSPEVANKIQNALNSEGIYIDEISPYNMGRLDGIPVVFDYAGT